MNNDHKQVLKGTFSSGVVFWSGLNCGQIAGGLFRVSCAIPPLSSVAGSVVVGLSLATQMEMSARLFGPVYRLELSAEYLSYIIGGMGLYASLGGRFCSVFASDVLRPGAFSSSPLPASQKYATASKRELIKAIGEKHGCHTCGTRSATVYHADHMPPLKIAKVKTPYWVERIFGFPRQMFYSQCSSFSTIQSAAARESTKFSVVKRLMYHPHVLRAYHATGFIQGFILFMVQEKKNLKS